jgi:hypothetical protein
MLIRCIASRVCGIFEKGHSRGTGDSLFEDLQMFSKDLWTRCKGLARNVSPRPPEAGQVLLDLIRKITYPA